jgi:ABC-type Fe3+ transport system permease subunit
MISLVRSRLLLPLSALLLMAAAFRSMDPTLEEASSVSGAPHRYTLRRVTLPLTRRKALAGKRDVPELVLGGLGNS